MESSVGAASTGERTRVLLVEDHHMVAEGLTEVLDREEDLEVLPWARSVGMAQVAIRDHDPHVVLMDFHLPDGDGVQATRLILDDRPDVAVVMLTAEENDEVLRAALQAGCCGYITKDLPAEQVVAAVRTARAGGSSIAPELLARALPRLAGQEPTRATAALTDRQLEVLGLLVEGRSTEGIAEELSISVNTVRNHVQAVLDRLDVGSRLEAVAIARREGLHALDGRRT